MSFLCLLSSSGLSVSKYANIVSVERVMQHFFPNVGIDHVLCRKLSIRRLQTHVNGNESSSHCYLTYVMRPVRVVVVESLDRVGCAGRKLGIRDGCHVARHLDDAFGVARDLARVERANPNGDFYWWHAGFGWRSRSFVSLSQGEKEKNPWINFVIRIKWHPRLRYLEENIHFHKLLRCWFRNRERRTRQLHCAHVLCFEEIILISKILHLATGIGFELLPTFRS